MSAWLACVALAAIGAPPDRPALIVVVGAPGTPEYGAEFRRWADLWAAAAEAGGAGVVRVGAGPPGAQDDRETLRRAVAEAAGGPPTPLWIVLIGHGTFDGREARFNLRGPDLTDADLLAWLGPVRRPTAIVDGSSASGPFLGRLSAPGRIVVAATRSGDEQNFARFGGRIAESIADPAADLDKDGQVSLLEAFLAASGRVEADYKAKGRLATEHALIDDDGDRLGTPAALYGGTLRTPASKDGKPVDGRRAHQLHLKPSDRERSIPAEARARRDAVEIAVAELRDRKASMAEDDYYRALEPLMIELADIYRAAEAPPPPPRPQ